MQKPIIKVDANGVCAAGECYDHEAAPELVVNGLMVNKPVVLQYPDGTLKNGNQVMITTKGLAELKKQFRGSEH